MHSETPPRLKVAVGSVPKDGGTFTFYRNLRSGLRGQGVDVRCVTVGRQEAELIEPAFLDEGCVTLAADEAGRKRQSMAFETWCRSEGVDIVMALNSVAILSALSHLPSHIRVVSRCANAFEHGFRITVSCRERLHRVIATSPGQVPVLRERFGIAARRLVLVRNGADPERFAAARRAPRFQSDRLRLAFLGRLEHAQKGVLYLPLIAAALERLGVSYSLKIAGKGKHEAVLKRRFRALSGQRPVEFVGALEPCEIQDFLAQTDVLLFPSRFEGSPNVLIEGMMAGCLVAAWRIEAVESLTGNRKGVVLAPPADVAALAAGIAGLVADPDRARRSALGVAADAVKNHSLDRMCADYLQLFQAVMREPLLPFRPRPWQQFRVDPNFAEPLWKRWVPGFVARAGRRARARLRIAGNP